MILFLPSKIETAVNLFRHFHGNIEDGFSLENKSKPNKINIFRNFKTPTANAGSYETNAVVCVQSNKCFLIEAKRLAQLIFE